MLGFFVCAASVYPLHRITSSGLWEFSLPPQSQSNLERPVVLIPDLVTWLPDPIYLLNGESMSGENKRDLVPIVYAQPMDVRFSDLDPYGHVSTGRYMDIVIASRYIFFTNYFKLPIEELTKNDLGFFTSRLEINYHRPISRVLQVLAESSMKITEPGKELITFEMKRIEDGKVFASGQYVEHPVKLSTGKPQPLPDWAHRFFFQT